MQPLEVRIQKLNDRIAGLITKIAGLEKELKELIEESDCDPDSFDVLLCDISDEIDDKKLLLDQYRGLLAGLEGK